VIGFGMIAQDEGAAAVEAVNVAVRNRRFRAGCGGGVIARQSVAVAIAFEGST
jgi:hypothetical protein